MQNSWGLNGDRLLLTMDMIFTSSQLYEREEFLGGIGGANILHVVKHHSTFTSLHVKGGGWRVALGEGPAGTDLLRFFVDIEASDASHSHSDDHCPKGRIYFNCGYFYVPKRGDRDRLRKELEYLQRDAEKFDQDIMDSAWMSVDTVKNIVKRFQLQSKIRDTSIRLNYASIVEPDESKLSYSSKKLVALTKEGGVCCKVVNTLTHEYQVLGRFSIKSNFEIF